MKKIFISNRILLSLLGVILLLTAILLVVFLYKEKDETHFHYGSVVANGIECAEIGANILKMNGTSIDAVIATLFCEGVTCPQSGGLGGGFIATMYTKSTGKIETLIAREVAPIKADEKMFVNLTNEDIKARPGLEVAVPGELRGYWQLHQKYGRLPWKTLIQPTIELCRRGHIVTSYLAAILKTRENEIRNISSLSKIFINPSTKSVWKEGDLIKRIKLAETFEEVANEGENAIYGGGKIGKMLVEDIQNFGGIITEQDLKEYKVRWMEPVVVDLFNDYKLYSTPLPGSGSVLGYILNILRDYLPKKNLILMYHRIVESFKHAYGLRTHLGDIDFVPEIKNLLKNMVDPNYAKVIQKLIYDDRTFTNYTYYGANFSNSIDQGTLNTAVLAPNGDGIVVTSTVNNILGAKIISEQTGILLNDEMDDFSTPGTVNKYGLKASPANFIKPKKSPLSSMCPSIILDKNGNIKLLVGGAGGPKITTSVAYTIIRNLYFDIPLYNAVQEPRLHHQLAPMVVQYENGLDKNVMNGLKKLGHEFELNPADKGFSSITAISNNLNKKVEPVFDNRRNGSTSIISVKMN